MYKPNKSTLASIAAIAAVSAPSTASARLNLEGSYKPPAPPVVSAPVIQHPSSPTAAESSTASSKGFQWDDAAIGAAGMLVLIGLGSGTVVARRHRTGPLAG